MITVSTDAQKYLIKLLNTQNEGTQLRIFVSNPGTNYADCGICFYYPIMSSAIEDTIIKLDLLSLYIHQFDLPFVQDAKIDIINESLASKLTISAPNIKKIYHDHLYNDPSITLEKRIRNVLHFKINPQLSQHGGKVSLVKVTDDYSAIIEFHGGCNGCSMAHYTIKEGIEHTLKKLFPEITKIIDATQHQRGQHSYY